MSIQGNRDQRTISRRHLLGWAGMGAGGLAIAASRFSPSRALAKPFFAGDPFSLGVASGDPLPDGVVLWSRLAPEPLAEDGRAGCRLRPTGSATRWPRTRASRAYVADRRALVDLFADADGGAPTNPVVLTGDIHNNRIFDLKASRRARRSWRRHGGAQGALTASRSSSAR